MSLQLGAAKACLQVQQTLDDIAGGNVTALRVDNFGLLQWLTSPFNTSGFQGLQVQDPGGKNRTVKVWYWANPRTPASTSANPDICTAGDTSAQKHAELTLSYNRSVSLTLDEEQFRSFCDSGESGSSSIRGSRFAEQQMQAVINQLLDGIDTDAATYLAAHAGNFYGGVSGPKSLILLKSDGSVYHGAETTVSNDLEDIGFVGQPAAIGLGYLRTYSKTAQIACCDQSGVDVSKRASSTWVYYSDRRIDSAVGSSNNFFVLAPGAMQLVSKVRWVGPYEDIRPGGNDAKTTVVVPVPGGGSIPVDFTVHRDFCGSNNTGLTSWVMTWSLQFDFFSLPSDAENVSSNWKGVNGILHYVGTCGAPTCFDVNS